MSNFHVVYLALGSNLGNRAGHLQATLRAIAEYAKVEETSFLYETKSQYVTDQPDYLNAVCRVSTSLSPHELLAANEQLMYNMGRRRTAQYGTPRPIDIDILLYDDLQLQSEDLIIPHALMAERTFVLEPLCDIAPEVRHPVLGRTLRELLTALHAPPLRKVMPIGNQLWAWGHKTYIVGILNVTPDSFFGDGLMARSSNVVAEAVAQAQSFAAEGADCLDVGGMSTRPGHRLIPVEEEIARVVPVIRALVQTVKMPISIDTFRSEVAQAALDAGAHLINDIWGLRFDQQQARLAAERAEPLVLMHNRVQPAEPAYRARLESLPFGPAYHYQDVMQDISRELIQSLALAQAMGVPRWHLLIDPGIGFGKTVAQNLEVIRRLAELKTLGYPILFASSRKSFVGKVLDGLPAEERGEGTLATSILALERGADLLRVHDVRAMSRAARMTDAIVRNVKSN